jgi:hypothetical protein
MSRHHHETTTAARKKYGEPLICVQKNVYRFGRESSKKKRLSYFVRASAAPYTRSARFRFLSTNMHFRGLDGGLWRPHTNRDHPARKTSQDSF